MRPVALLPSHVEELVRLERLCFSVPWSRAMLLEELRNPIARYVGFAGEDGTLFAYGGIQIVADEAYITNIATDPSYRRQGLGERVLCLLLDIAGRQDVWRVGLEVREGNEAAQALYKKQGFIVEGRRKDYYDRPREDALLLNYYPRRTDDAL